MATQRYVPACCGVKSPDVAEPFCSDTESVKIGAAVQLASCGPCSLKVTVPVGLLPPVTVAVSWIGCPVWPCVGAGVVEIWGTCFTRMGTLKDGRQRTNGCWIVARSRRN